MAAGKDEAAALAAAKDRALAALQGMWEAERAPLEAFAISFRAGWRGCGEAMAAMACFDVRDVEWEHQFPHHTVRFRCTYKTLKSVQTAVLGTQVVEPRCRRMTGSDAS